jgi:hypothetical protein
MKKQEEKKYYVAFGKDGINYMLSQEEFQSLMIGKERFVFLWEDKIWITEDYIIKIEEY